MNPSQHAEAVLIDVDGLLQLLPHRYPFLLVDRILEIERGTRIRGLKNVTRDEPFFGTQAGSDAVMPGLLIIEAMAQTGALLLLAEQKPTERKLVYFASLDNATWQGVVRPGDQLRLDIAVTQARGRLRKVHGVASVDGVAVCEADLAAVVVDTDLTAAR
jgi:beta-hydroxyacyl-ACP dehydratase FabZ